MLFDGVRLRTWSELIAVVLEEHSTPGTGVVNGFSLNIKYRRKIGIQGDVWRCLEMFEDVLYP